MDDAPTVPGSRGLVLSWAIQARQLVRDALDRDDMPAVRELNRLADGIYLCLDPLSAKVYGEWAHAHLEPEPLTVGSSGG
jgi:hypothetical protein